MKRDEVCKEAVAFLGDELRLSELHKRKQQENWHAANRRLAAASADIQLWQLWRFVQQWAAAKKITRTDAELRRIDLKKAGIQRAMVTLGGGYAPNEAVLDIFQQIANEAHVAARMVEGIAGIENGRLSERAKRAHQLTGQLRAEYRAAYCRAA